MSIKEIDKLKQKVKSLSNDGELQQKALLKSMQKKIEILEENKTVKK